MNCNACNSSVFTKYGTDAKGKSRHKCSNCGRVQVSLIEPNRLTAEDKDFILKCKSEGIGIRRTCRLLNQKCNWTTIRAFLKKSSQPLDNTLSNLTT